MGQQSHRSAPQNNDRISGFDTSVLYSPPGCRHNVREEHQLFILHLGVLRDDKRAEIAIGHTQQLCLSPGKPAIRIRISQIAPGILRLISMITLALHLMLAEKTLAAGYIEGNNDPVPPLHLGDFRPDVLHNPHRLMPNNIIAMHPGNLTVVDMKVRAADGCGSDAYENVILFLKLRIGNIFDFYFSFPLICYCSHGADHSFRNRDITQQAVSGFTPYYVIPPNPSDLSMRQRRTFH
ncbi:hypothetical protein D3C75_635300 [compost metagenome]